MLRAAQPGHGADAASPKQDERDQAVLATVSRLNSLPRAVTLPPR